jgi:hypothetical protein
MAGVKRVLSDRAEEVLDAMRNGAGLFARGLPPGNVLVLGRNSKNVTNGVIEELLRANRIQVVEPCPSAFMRKYGLVQRPVGIAIAKRNIEYPPSRTAGLKPAPSRTAGLKPPNKPRGQR